MRLVGNSYQYKGDLGKEVDKCEKELKKLLAEEPMYNMIKEKAIKEHKSKLKRINDLRGFVRLAKEELEKREKLDG